MARSIKKIVWRKPKQTGFCFLCYHLWAISPWLDVSTRRERSRLRCSAGTVESRAPALIPTAQGVTAFTNGDIYEWRGPWVTCSTRKIGPDQSTDISFWSVLSAILSSLLTDRIANLSPPSEDEEAISKDGKKNQYHRTSGQFQKSPHRCLEPWPYHENVRVTSPSNWHCGCLRSLGCTPSYSASSSVSHDPSACFQLKKSLLQKLIFNSRLGPQAAFSPIEPMARRVAGVCLFHPNVITNPKCRSNKQRGLLPENVARPNGSLWTWKRNTWLGLSC